MSNIVPIAEVRTMAKTVATSGLMGFKNENQAMTLMLLAQAENLHPMKAMQQYHIINGKPALKSSEVLSRFQLSGGKIDWITTTDEIAEAKLEHPQGGNITIKWDISKAKQAGIYDSNPVWKKYPSNMLRSRVVTDGVNALFPACLGGNMTESTAQDILIEDKETEEIDDVEIVENYVNDVTADKKILATKLKKLDFSNADMKDFFEKHIASDEVLHNVINDDNLLMELVTEFEGK